MKLDKIFNALSHACMVDSMNTPTYTAAQMRGNMKRRRLETGSGVDLELEPDRQVRLELEHSSMLDIEILDEEHAPTASCSRLRDCNRSSRRA